MKTLYKKLTGKTAPSSVSSLWLKKQIEWYTQNGKKWEKEIRQLLALDIKNKTAYQSGTKLVREYEHRSPDGSGACGVKKYEVLILDGCFVYEGIQYKSLSKIAEEITGTRWNGKVFFRLTGSASARPSNLTQQTIESGVGLKGGSNG